jgi:hypothetical protein
MYEFIIGLLISVALVVCCMIYGYFTDKDEYVEYYDSIGE